jgi:hypothetical protein
MVTYSVQEEFSKISSANSRSIFVPNKVYSTTDQVPGKPKTVHNSTIPVN